MRTYEYTCSECGRTGTIQTTDQPPHPDGLCKSCWEGRVAEVCRELMVAQHPHPIRLEFLLEMCVKTHALDFVPPLRMMRLDETLLRRILERRGVAVVEVMARLANPLDAGPPRSP